MLFVLGHMPDLDKPGKLSLADDAEGEGGTFGFFPVFFTAVLVQATNRFCWIITSALNPVPEPLFHSRQRDSLKM